MIRLNTPSLMQDNAPFAAGPLFKATFVDRPNRFLVRCESPTLGTIEAFLPNPGRMWELLLPGATLYVGRAGATGGPRKTAYTAMAVERDGRPVLLDTHATNHVARRLIERGSIPFLRGAEVLRSEVTVGRSRFDFLLRKGRREILLEVKSCTLFGNGVAMFPDAVTERGRRHLLELGELAEHGTRAAVLFVVHTPTTRWFMPDYHTDPAFSQALLQVRRRVRILPVAIAWRPDLTLAPGARMLEIPWTHVRTEAQDRGSYLLLLRLDRTRTVRVGGLGDLTFRRGYYVYVGSAMNGLSARIARHLRRRKKLRWHADYLRAHADEAIALPIRSSRRLECAMAGALEGIMPPGPSGFGSSDCRCATHLFLSETNPLERPDFHNVLQQFRMRRPS